MISFPTQPEDPKPTAGEVIAKAVASGVLSREGLSVGAPPDSARTKKKRKKLLRVFSRHVGIPMTITAQNKVTPKKIMTQDANSPRPFRC